MTRDEIEEELAKTLYEAIGRRYVADGEAEFTWEELKEIDAPNNLRVTHFLKQARAVLTRLAEIAEAEGVKGLTETCRDAEYDRAYAIGYRGGYAKHGQSMAAHVAEGPSLTDRANDLRGADARLAAANKHLPSSCWIKEIAGGPQ